MARRLSMFGMYCVLFNALVGAGVLSLPFAFQTGGVLVALLLLFTVLLVNWLLHLEVLEITRELTLLEVRKDPIRQSLMPEDSVLLSGYYWDLPSIVRLILGQLWFRIYSLIFYIYAVFGTSFYTIVWARAFSMIVSDVHTEEELWGWKYRLGTGVFTVVIGVITVFDYTKQVWLHGVAFLLQLLLAGSVIFTPPPDSIRLPYLVSPNLQDYFYTLEMISLACMYLVCLPSALAAADKHIKTQKQTAFWLFLSTLVMYASIGVVAAFRDGEFPSTLLSLFTTASMRLKTVSDTSLIAIIIVLDLTSNAPIYCQVFSGAVFSAIYSPNHEDERNKHPQDHLCIRLGSTLPAFIIANTLGRHLVSGTSGIIVTVLFIPVCHNYLSRTEANNKLRVKLQGLRGLNYSISGVCGAILLGFGLKAVFGLLPDLGN